MFYILFFWFLFLIVFCGLGLSFIRLFDLKNQDSELVLSSFWIGFGLTIIILQIWNFIAPVNKWADLALIIAGLTGIMWNRYQLLQIFKNRRIAKLVFSLVLCLFALWLANRAMGRISGTGGDAGIYHIQSIKWMSSYPIIPGLGNLQDRYAFNTSYFLYMALLNVGPNHMANHLGWGLLLFVLVAQIGVSVSKFILKRDSVQPFDIFQILFLYPVMHLCYRGPSTSYDKPIFLLAVLIGAELCKLLFTHDNYNKIRFSTFLIIFLSAIGITIKLSFIGFGFAASLIAIGKYISFRFSNKDRIGNPKELFLISTILLLIFLPWITRGVVLSGYVAYPATIGSFDVEWKIPQEEVASMMKVIKCWGRNPELVGQPDEVLANWDWFFPWLKRLADDKYVVRPLILAIIGAFFIFYRRKIRDFDLAYDLLFLLPAFISIVFWFITAPDPRFGRFAFWYLGIGTLTLAMKRWQLESHPKVKLFLLISVVIITGRVLIMSEIQHEFSPTPPANLQTLKTNSGLTVYRTTDGYCWDAPLPCTQSVNPNLLLIKKGDFKSGFMISSENEDR